MTGRAGSRHSVSFPLLRTKEKEPAEASEFASPIVLLRKLWADKCLVEEKLESLGLDEDGMHGDLQVILSALRRMERAAELLIAVEEADPGPRAKAAGGAA